MCSAQNEKKESTSVSVASHPIALPGREGALVRFPVAWNRPVYFRNRRLDKAVNLLDD